MDNTTLILSDIFGTVDVSGDTFEKSKEMKKLFYNLEQLKEFNASDNLIFSLFTSEDMKYVLNYYEDFINYSMNSNINFGYLFASDKYIYSYNEPKDNKFNSKIEEMTFFIEHVYSKCLNITDVYYIEDSLTNNMICTTLLKCFIEKTCKKKDIELPNFVSIMPSGDSKNNLGETNSNIEKQFKVLKKHM